MRNSPRISRDCHQNQGPRLSSMSGSKATKNRKTIKAGIPTNLLKCWVVRP